MTQVIAAWRESAKHLRTNAPLATLQQWTITSEGKVFALLRLDSGESQSVELVDADPDGLQVGQRLEPAYRLLRVHADTGYREYGIKYRVQR